MKEDEETKEDSYLIISDNVIGYNQTSILYVKSITNNTNITYNSNVVEFVKLYFFNGEVSYARQSLYAFKYDEGKARMYYLGKEYLVNYNKKANSEELGSLKVRWTPYNVNDNFESCFYI